MNSYGILLKSRAARADHQATAAMLIRLENPSKVDDLCLHYQRSGFVAERVGSTAVMVRQPEAPSSTDERVAIRMHLCIWSLSNPATATRLN
jgi:hypothetical protein